MAWDWTFGAASRTALRADAWPSQFQRLARPCSRSGIGIYCIGIGTLAVAGLMPFGIALAQTQPPAASQAPAAAPAAKPKPKKKPGAEDAAAKAKAPKKDPALAQQQIDQGIASLQGGKVDAAVQQLTAALSGGSLPASLMAKAYYQRGIAYRKQAKPALAISDLTSALWLKGGLTDTERSDALQNRSASYRDAGLPDQADADQAASAPTQRTQQTAASDTATASLPSRPPAPAPAVGLVPQENASSTGSGLGGFFGSIFGSGSSTSTATSAPPAGSSKPEPVVSGWSTATAAVKSTSNPPAPVVTAAAPTTAVPVTATAKSGRRFLVQVAQLRSHEEAQAVAAKLKQQMGADLAGRDVSIDAAVVGGMGTLHRVRFGPFTDASEWRSLCPKLLSSGHDCQPLPQ